MKECKKTRKLTRKASLRFLYQCYTFNCYSLNITVKYKTFKSYCNALRSVNSIEVNKIVKRMFRYGLVANFLIAKYYGEKIL